MEAASGIRDPQSSVHDARNKQCQVACYVNHDTLQDSELVSKTCTRIRLEKTPLHAVHKYGGTEALPDSLMT